MITVIIFIKIQTKAFSALPSCVLKMFAATIKEHNASQVYTGMFVTNSEKKNLIKTSNANISIKTKALPPAHHQPSLHVGLHINHPDQNTQ